MIESALGRARNRFFYDVGTPFDCAAAYLYGLAKNHGYADANKRTAYQAATTFLRLNGWKVLGNAEDIITLMLQVAQDQVDEAQIATWLQERATAL